MPKWTVNDMPDQSGRIAVVTGANSGLGYETTLALARKGAEVIMACRNMDKAQAAYDAIRSEIPDAKLELMALDLGSLDSVREFAEAFKDRYKSLDLLINNAGLMAIPRRETEDGFEMQFGVNHLGHFALTGLLLDRIVNAPESRIVTVTSTANWMGRIRFDDLQGDKKYSRYGAYGQSKLANIMFTFELQRRLEAAGYDTLALTAHPGLSFTNLQAHTVEQTGSLIERAIYGIVMPLLSQSPAKGALSQLYAATAPEAQGAEFYGPHFLHTRGYPEPARANRAAYDEAAARRLWEVSEELTGVHYDILEKQPA